MSLRCPSDPSCRTTIAWCLLLVLQACSERPEQVPVENIAVTAVLGTPAATAEPESVPQPGWPASLKLVGDGFPNRGDPCRRIGETAATVDFLDDSASLVGCRAVSEAQALGGRIVGTVDGITLVSVRGHAPGAMH